MQFLCKKAYQLKQWELSNYPTPSRIQYHDRFNQTETTLRASFIILNIAEVNYLQNSSIAV